MNEHDDRCEGGNDPQVLDDVAEYGWHVVQVLDTVETPGWTFSIGLYRNFDHPEVVVFGLDADLMHSVINSIGEDVRSGKKFKIDGEYPDLIEAYLCTFKPVDPVWYYPFLGYATWFYKSLDYPVLQCIWPDKSSCYPWNPRFNADWLWAQPLLYHQEPEAARTVELLKSMEA